MSVYLFDMQGHPVAFRRTWSDPYVFDIDGEWVGWLPWDDNDVVDRHGDYLGSVVDDRLVRRNDWSERVCTQDVVDPGPATCSGAPTSPHYFPNCFAYEDAPIPHHA